jgi:RNA polymerase sigma factor (sigma-70 family)
MATTAITLGAATGSVILPGGFPEVYQRYSDLVYRVALRVTGNSEDAEDVLQNVFLRLLNNRVLLDSDWAPERYLRRSATNAAIDIIRRRISHAETPLDEGPERSTKESSSVLKQRLREAIARLEPAEAEIFVLCYVEGYSYEELAEQFGVQKGTVASRLFRIRQTLKQELEK